MLDAVVVDSASAADGAPGSDAGISVDGTPTGAKCQDSSQCADPAAACDPMTGTCSTTDGCSNTMPCPTGQLCQLDTSPGKVIFACYQACALATAGSQSTCPTGFACVPVEGDFAGVNSNTAACYQDGPAARDGNCTFTDISTGCRNPNDVCVGETIGNFCREICDRTSAAPGCESGQACGIRDWCVPDMQIASAHIGASCTNLEGPCGPVVNGDVTGYCDPGDSVCRPICDLKADGGCPGAQTCHVAQDETLQFGECE